MPGFRGFCKGEARDRLCDEALENTEKPNVFKARRLSVAPMIDWTESQAWLGVGSPASHWRHKGGDQEKGAASTIRNQSASATASGSRADAAKSSNMPR